MCPTLVLRRKFSIFAFFLYDTLVLLHVLTIGSSAGTTEKFIGLVRTEMFCVLLVPGYDVNTYIDTQGSKLGILGTYIFQENAKCFVTFCLSERVLLLQYCTEKSLERW